MSQGLAAKIRSTNILRNARLAENGIYMRPTEVAVKDTLKKYADNLAQTKI